MPSDTPERPPLGPGLAIFAVAQVIWGLLSLCGGAMSGVGAAAPSPAGTGTGLGGDPTVLVWATYPVLRWTTLVHSVLACLWGCGFVAGAVGIFLRAPWARTLTLVCAWAGLGALLLDTLISGGSLFTSGIVQHLGAREEAVRVAAYAATAMVGCGVGIGAVFPIVALVVLTRRGVRAQFEPRGGGGDTGREGPA